MPNPEGVKFSVAKRAERTVPISTLKPGSAFRLQDVTFEEATGGDDAGGCFYHVDGEEKEGLIPVVSFDWKVRRKLPKETKVHPHHIETVIHPCQHV